MERTTGLLGVIVLLAACHTAAHPDALALPEGNAPPAAAPSGASDGAPLVIPRRGGARHPARSARDLFVEGERVDPALRDYQLYFLGRAQVARGDHEAAFDTFARLVRDVPDSVWTHEAALRAARLAYRRGDAAETTRLLSIAQGPGPPADRIAAEATLFVARLRERRGEHGDALSSYRRIRRHGPPEVVGRARARADRLRARAPDALPHTSPRTLIDEMELRVRERNRAGVEEIGREWDTRFGEHRLRPRALLLRARAAADQKAAADAEQLWRTIVEQYPASREAKQALFSLARASWNRDEDATAARMFSRFLRRYPHHPLAAQALYARGRIHQQAGQWEAARAEYTQFLRSYPRNPLAPEVAWRRAWLSYLAGNPERAAAEFGALAARAGSTAEDALYWQARSLEESRGSAAAAPLYVRLVRTHPRGYYALWAATRVPSPEPAPGAATAPPSPPPTGLPRAAADHLARYQALSRLDCKQWARRELDATPRHLDDRPGALLYVAEQYVTVDGYRAAVAIATRLNTRRHFARAERSRLDRLLYPRGYWTLIEREATRRDLDPYLVAAVMRQESLFDPRAHSPADARGLMQLLPSTAARIATDHPPSAADLFDPSLNVHLATAYLRSLIERYDGSWVRALAAYNAGEDAVEKWDARTPEAPADVFVEEISYRETRQFVKSVLRHYRTYRSIYTPGACPTVPTLQLTQAGRAADRRARRSCRSTSPRPGPAA